MRIMFTTYPALGHLLPMVPLAVAARRAGHDVLVVSGVDVELECKRRGLPFTQAGPGVPDTVPSAADRGQPVASPMANLFGPAAQRRAEELLPLAVHWRPDVIVHEPSELAGAVAAACTGARHVVHGLGMWTDAVWPNFEPAYSRLAQRWRVRPGAFLEALYLDPYPRALQPAGPADFRRVQQLRPDAPPDLPAILDLPRDPLYLTMGTVFDDDPALFRTVLAGLTTLPHDVLVTVGPDADLSRVGDWPARVRITDFVPQEQLLPNCRMVVSHGAAGTVTGALRHGLPQLVLPRGADNFHNAAAVHAAGAGLWLPPDELTPETIAGAARRVLDEPSFTASAALIAAEIDAMPAPDEVLDLILHRGPPR